MNLSAKSADTIGLKSCRNPAGKNQLNLFLGLIKLVHPTFPSDKNNLYFTSSFALPHPPRTRNILNLQSCGFMYGELTDKETVARVEYALEHQQHDQFEILLYKKNSK